MYFWFISGCLVRERPVPGQKHQGENLINSSHTESLSLSVDDLALLAHPTDTTARDRYQQAVGNLVETFNHFAQNQGTVLRRWKKVSSFYTTQHPGFAWGAG